MKIRKGFVSNSSSSSFICDVCGNAESGWDSSISDFDMFECKNGHTICNSHAIGDISKAIEESDEGSHEIPVEHCPICSMKVITDQDFRSYIQKVSPKDFEKEIKEKFTYDQFKKFIEDK